MLTLPILSAIALKAMANEMKLIFEFGQFLIFALVLHDIWNNPETMTFWPYHIRLKCNLLVLPIKGEKHNISQKREKAEVLRMSNIPFYLFPEWMTSCYLLLLSCLFFD